MKIGLNRARVQICVNVWLDFEVFMLDIGTMNIWEHGFGLINEKLIIFIYEFT